MEPLLEAAEDSRRAAESRFSSLSFFLSLNYFFLLTKAECAPCIKVQTTLNCIVWKVDSFPCSLSPAVTMADILVYVLPDFSFDEYMCIF